MRQSRPPDSVGARFFRCRGKVRDKRTRNIYNLLFRTWRGENLWVFSLRSTTSNRQHSQGSVKFRAS
jgi:hypothetical protein